MLTGGGEEGFMEFKNLAETTHLSIPHSFVQNKNAVYEKNLKTILFQIFETFIENNLHEILRISSLFDPFQFL